MKLYSRPRLILRATLYSNPAPTVHPLRQSSNEKRSGSAVLRPETSTCAPAQPPFAYSNHWCDATPTRPVTVAIVLISVLYVTAAGLTTLRASSLRVVPLRLAS